MAPVQPASVAPPVSRPAAAAPPSATHELRTLVLSRHPAIVVETAEEERADGLLREVALGLDLPVFEWTVTRGLAPLDGTPGQGIYGTAEPAKALATIPDLKGDAVYVLKDFARHLQDAALSRRFRELLGAAEHRLTTFVLLGARVELPAEVEPCVVHFELPEPTRDDYRRMVIAVAESLRTNARAHVDLTPQDCDALAGALAGLTLNQARQALARAAIEDGRLTSDDVHRLADIKARALKDDGLLEYFPPADNPTELGGFAGLRRWLDRAKLAMSPQAAQLNVPAPRGVMLVGVQGCGKSLAAKYVARAWQMPLVKLDAGRLFDKYVGETERNLRKAIATAEQLAPCVLWMDEIEKALAPSGDSDGGVSRRVFGTFLTWLQEKRADVFVVATANDLSILPPELLRKGRFDEIFFVDLPDAAEREEIFAIHLRLRAQDPGGFDLAALAAAADGFSGAEIEQAVIAAVLQALHDGRPLDTATVCAELRGTVPLSRSRAEDVQRLRQWAAGRFVPVNGR
jgi:hypothetical protein